MSVLRITSFTDDYRFLSNFYPSPILFEGRIWHSVEHAYQATKTEATDWKDRIHAAPTAARAKQLGKMAPLRPDWDSIRVEVMRTLISLKFASHTSLAERLRVTAPAELVEGNWWGDRFWGESPLGVGENWLGRLLMDHRQRLMESV